VLELHTFFDTWKDPFGESIQLQHLYRAKRYKVNAYPGSNMIRNGTGFRFGLEAEFLLVKGRLVATVVAPRFEVRNAEQPPFRISYCAVREITYCRTAQMSTR